MSRGCLLFSSCLFVVVFFFSGAVLAIQWLVGLMNHQPVELKLTAATPHGLVQREVVVVVVVFLWLDARCTPADNHAILLCTFFFCFL
jgi:hypothetical protein